MDISGVTLEQLGSAHHRVLDGLRTHGPVVWVPVLGAWVVVGRELAVQVMRDDVRFTVDDPRFATARVVGPSMLSLDGAEHRRHRDPFIAAFRPPVVLATHAPRVAAEARRLVDRIAPAGHGDLLAELAGPLAAWTAASALGLENVGPATMLAWYRRIVAATEEHAIGPARPAAIDDAARTAMYALRIALVDASRDPESALSAVADELSEDELVSNAAVFLFGAIETTEGMIANLLVQLLGDAPLLAAVLADRGLVDRAIEESLRFEPAVSRVDRYATTDVELGGVRIAAGDFVVVSLAGANRDPLAYDRPHEFRLDRDGEPGHLTFVQGPHACIGAQLARIEARAAVAAVLDLLPSVHLAATPTGAAIDGVVFRKPRSVPAEWDRVVTP